MRVYGYRITALLLLFSALLSAVAAVAAVAAGCARGEKPFPGGDLPTRSAAADASFTVVFPSATNLDEDVRCAGEKRADGAVLTVVSPERSAGIVIGLRLLPDGGGFAVSVSGPDFPEPAAIDPAAARALTDVFAALYALRSLHAADGNGDAAPGGTDDADDADDTAVFAADAGLLPAVRRLEGDGGEETAFLFEGGARLIVCADGLPVRVECPDAAGVLRTVVFEEYGFIQ